jgi:hypothetical protein
MMRGDPHDRRRRRLLDDARRGGDALLGRRARLERGTPEVPGGHARRYEQAEPQRIE